TELRPQMRRETPRRQRAIELRADDVEDLAVAESGVNWHGTICTRPHHFEKTNTLPPSVNVSVGSETVAITESLEDAA
ncbi:MAG: hypothetical protein JWO39_3023, partial [Gemmatimonadetes bacterium]|nr:hypothetical protein [Gemmatimonadota bacterium]